jgi:hypothetical protein
MGCDTDDADRLPGDASGRELEEPVRLDAIPVGGSGENRGGAFMMADDESEVDMSNRRALALRGDIVPNELVRGN